MLSQGAQGERSAGAPEPSAIRTRGAFIKGLRLLRVEAGDPSLRDLARATGIPRSTLAVLFDARRPRLPRLDRCVAVLRALGMAEPQVREWAVAWKRIQGTELQESDSLGAAAVDTDAEEAEATHEPATATDTGDRRAHGRRYGRWHLVAAFSIGVTLAVLSTLILHQLTQSQTAPSQVLVGDYAVCQRGAIASNPPAPDPGPPRPSRARSDNPPAWIGRPASDAQILTTSHVALPFTAAVAEGHTLVVTVMLTSTCPGTVVATDSRRNAYHTVADVADSSRHRVLIIAAFGVSPLTTADSLTLTYPQASKYHVAVDEFSNLAAVTQSATASGRAGGTAFSTGPTPNPCTPGQLQVAAIGTNTGSAPTPSSEWTVIEPPLRLSSYRLTTAYRLTLDKGPCAATGTTTAEWAAALATFS